MYICLHVCSTVILFKSVVAKQYICGILQCCMRIGVIGHKCVGVLLLLHCLLTDFQCVIGRTANLETWEDDLHHPLTWSLVFDEEKLQTLLESVLIHVKLYLHPDREEKERKCHTRLSSTKGTSHADVVPNVFTQHEYSWCCFCNHLPVEGLAIICLWFCSQPQDRGQPKSSCYSMEVDFTKN